MWTENSANIWIATDDEMRTTCHLHGAEINSNRFFFQYFIIQSSTRPQTNIDSKTILNGNILPFILFFHVFVRMVRLRCSGRGRSTARHHMNDFCSVFLQMPYDSLARQTLSCVCILPAKIFAGSNVDRKTKNDRQINQLHILHELLLPLYFFSVEFQELCCGVRVDSLGPPIPLRSLLNSFAKIYLFLISQAIKLKHVGVIKSNK